MKCLSLLIFGLIFSLSIQSFSKENFLIKKREGKVYHDVSPKIPIPNKLGSKTTINQTYYGDMGNQLLGSSTTWYYVASNNEPNTIMYYGTSTMSGSPDFTIVNDFCSGATLNYGQSCTYDVNFSPTSKALLKSQLLHQWSQYYFLPGIPPGWNNGTVTLEFGGSAFDKPCNCSESASGSVVGVDSQTLGESIPIVGTDLIMHYSSEFSPQYITTQSEMPTQYSFNFESWTSSLHHTYSPEQNRIFLGTGRSQEKIQVYLTSGNLAVVSDSGDEVYIFNPRGKHLETRTSLMGALKYTFGYDGNDRLTSITDVHGNQITYTRSGSGKITSITGPHGQVTTFTLDGSGRFATVTNPNSETFTMTYKTGTSLLETFTKPGGQVTTFTYDANGRLKKDLGNGGNFWELTLGSGSITKSSQMNRTTTYTTSYDSWGAYTRNKTTPYGEATAHYETRNNAMAIYSPYRAILTSVVPDERFGYALNRESSFAETIASTTSTTNYAQTVNYGGGITPGLFNFSSITKTATNSGNVVTESFDNSTRQKLITTDEGATKKITYNLNEQPTEVQVGVDTATTITYDLLGRLSTTIQGSNNQKTYAYNAAGFLQSVTNALSEVTAYAYDLAGRVTSMTLPDLRVVQYSYDANGNLTGVTPPSRPAHNFTFNAFGLPSEYQPPALVGVTPVNTQYAYNMDKQLTQITRPTGGTLVNSYNSTTGLLSSVAITGNNTNTYTYYANSDFISRITANNGLHNNFTYYGDKLESEELVATATSYLLGKVTRSFDSLHRLSSIAVRGNPASSNTTSFVYNGDDQPTQIGSMLLTYSYPSGRLATTTLDKISDSRTYDAYGNLSGYSSFYNPVSGPAVPLYSYTLTRDTLNRITSKSETIQGVTDVYDYSYDSAGRLTTVLKNSSAYSSYVYDTNGNRTSGVTAGTSFSATYDDQDRMLSYGSLTFNYNNNGDLIERIIPGIGTYEYTYDAVGNLRAVKNTSGVITNYPYDGSMRLTSRIVGGVTLYRNIYENDYRVAGRVNSGGTLLEVYRHGTHVNTADAIIKGGNWHRIITDHLGSPRLVVKITDGTVAQRMDYNDLGGVTYDSAPGFQAYGFAGGFYFAGEGIVKFGARYYDPQTGRWLSKDPILFNGKDTNLYGYVLNDPINKIDPSGKVYICVARGMPECIKKKTDKRCDAKGDRSFAEDLVNSVNDSATCVEELINRCSQPPDYQTPDYST